MKLNKKHLYKVFICSCCDREFTRSHFCKMFYVMYDCEILYIKYYKSVKAEEYNFSCNQNEVQGFLNSFIKNLLFI